MSIFDWVILGVVVALLGALPTIAVVLYVDRKNALANSVLNARLDDIKDRLTTIDSAIVRSSIALEGSFTETIRKVQLDIIYFLSVSRKRAPVTISSAAMSPDFPRATRPRGKKPSLTAVSRSRYGPPLIKISTLDR